jgi:hypothetical protein
MKTIVLVITAALVMPTLALGQGAAPKPKLTAVPGSGFPDRTYILQLPSRAALTQLSVTENGGPVSGLSVERGTAQLSNKYTIRYRSLLPPQSKAVVEARVTGFASARTTYTTPALDFEPSGTSDRQWYDRQWYLMIFGVVAVLALILIHAYRRGLLP